jgi:hypothetical protein
MDTTDEEDENGDGSNSYDHHKTRERVIRFLPPLKCQVGGRCGRGAFGNETSHDIFENLWSVLDNLLVCRFHLCLDEIYFLPGLHHGFP